jgi:outer membrane protein OmpA-like peptidoglycan-associated protein
MNEFSPGITGRNESPCPEEVATLAEMSPPERDAQAQQLMKRIETASLLSDRFSPPPAGRDGEPGGLFQRGIGVESRALPVTFVYKEVLLTPKGEEAFSALVDYLKRSKASSIVLSGHTDPIGSDSYNCGLARQRLAALSGALSREIPGLQVTTIAVGEHEPFKPDDPEAYTTDEINQLNRRVKLIEGGAMPPKTCNG